MFNTFYLVIVIDYDDDDDDADDDDSLKWTYCELLLLVDWNVFAFKLFTHGSSSCLSVASCGIAAAVNINDNLNGHDVFKYYYCYTTLMGHTIWNLYWF